jgi:Nitronate monooxygenase
MSNLIAFFDNDAQIRVCAEEKVPVVSFHWGHPSSEHLKLLLDAGVSVWEQVGNMEAAKEAVGDGIEVIVAQGWESGGQNYGGLPTWCWCRKFSMPCHPHWWWPPAALWTDGALRQRSH